MIALKLKCANTVELEMKGKVTAADYKLMRPKLEKIFKEKGRMKFLINLDSLKSFSLGATYEDIKFDIQNLKDVGTTAIVGNKKAQETVTNLIDLIFPAKVKFFDSKRQAEALTWLQNY